MSGWLGTRLEVAGRYYGELLGRNPQLKRDVNQLIEVAETLWKWGKTLFWVSLAVSMACGLFFAVIGDILMYIAPSSPYGYAAKYNVNDSYVVMNRKPHDCEWVSAPLGDKHCHYKVEVSSVRTGTSKDGTTPLVSYDEGKTWSFNTDHVKPSVVVSWTKVEE